MSRIIHSEYYGLKNKQTNSTTEQVDLYQWGIPLWISNVACSENELLAMDAGRRTLI